jgi:hypothetical protein
MEKTKLSGSATRKHTKGWSKPRWYQQHTATGACDNTQVWGNHPRCLKDLSQRAVLQLIPSTLPNSLGTSQDLGLNRDALTNTIIAIPKENYPEDKLSKRDQKFTLVNTAGNFELPHLRSNRLEGGTLTYVCADLQSGQ